MLCIELLTLFLFHLKIYILYNHQIIILKLTNQNSDYHLKTKK
jgi:hypothetical protein